MKASELKIGNYIQLYRKSEDKEMTSHRVKSIYFDNVLNCYCVELEGGFIVNIEKGIEPIPLTEEILLKCGFEECTDYYFDGKSMFFYDIHKSLENSEFYIYFNENNKICLSIMEEEDIISKSLNIQYLHQLQNLYFALTNEELTINL